MNDLITVKQAARLMQRSRPWVDKLIARGVLEVATSVEQIGQPRPIRMLRRADVERLIARTSSVR